MAKVKVKLRVRSLSARPGDVVEVESDHAEHLIANGNATRVTETKSVKD